jgi:signal transduction histidine kinase
MLMPASSEFVALCQAQVALLTQGLGACLSVIYLTEEFTEAANPTLVPVVAYPEAIADWDNEQILALLYTGIRKSNSNLRLLPPNSQSIARSLPALPSAKSNSSDSRSGVPPAVEAALLQQQQIVLPLMHEGVVMGLLVTARADRHWTESEQTQIERIARTLAIACVLDQRGQWLAQDTQQRRMLQAQQHDLLDDLLHQFRNPLTAIRTFGKLLLRRVLPGDPNRNSIEGIVRESDRLKDLLQEFDLAIDMGEADLLPDDSENAGADWITAAEADTTIARPMPLLPSSRFLLGAHLQLEPHLIQEVLQPLLDSAEVIAQERQLQLRTKIPANLPPVQIDLKALREVLTNLIDNALKYTPAGGRVFVQVDLSSRLEGGEETGQLFSLDDRQAVVIADTGPGIPPEDLEHLFERHYRGVQAATDIPGTGLGLAIARELVTQMQGEIRVFSPARTYPLAPEFEHTLDSDTHPGTAVVVWLSPFQTD